MLNEIIRMMAEIDQAIEAHGGWPAAFETASEPADERPAFLRVAEPPSWYGVGEEQEPEAEPPIPPA